MSTKTKQAAVTAEAASAPAGAAIEVTSPAGARRRAGIDFGKLPTRLAADELTPEQWEAIAADPQLVVRPVKDGPPAADG